MNTPLITLESRSASSVEFVEFWSRQYSYDADRADLPYEENINKPLTRERIITLFEWKNGSRLSAKKLASVESNYIESSYPLPREDDAAEIADFLIQPGGVVWRVFWLHCNQPDAFPIYDQHVHRAMAHLQGRGELEIPSNYKARAKLYADDYRTFFSQFVASEHRAIDRALWAYGKFVKDYPKIFNP